jgi:hypothetical protein
MLLMRRKKAAVVATLWVKTAQPTLLHPQLTLVYVRSKEGH